MRCRNGFVRDKAAGSMCAVTEGAFGRLAAAAQGHVFLPAQIELVA